MGGTWDAWDNDPYYGYGGCGGNYCRTRTFKNKRNGEVITINVCDYFGGENACIISPQAKDLQYFLKNEEWDEI